MLLISVFQQHCLGKKIGNYSLCITFCHLEKRSCLLCLRWNVLWLDHYCRKSQKQQIPGFDENYWVCWIVSFSRSCFFSFLNHLPLEAFLDCPAKLFFSSLSQCRDLWFSGALLPLQQPFAYRCCYHRETCFSAVGFIENKGYKRAMWHFGGQKRWDNFSVSEAQEAPICALTRLVSY